MPNCSACQNFRESQDGHDLGWCETKMIVTAADGDIEGCEDFVPVFPLYDEVPGFDEDAAADQS